MPNHHISADDVLAHLAAQDTPTRRMQVELDAHQTSWNPASTKPGREIFGPAVIDYTQYADGGIEARVR